MSVAPPVVRQLSPRAPEVPLLVSIPHTGVHVPPEIAARFANPAMGRGVMTDWHLHDLYAFLPELGVEVIHATHHRFVVDLNRAPDSAPLYPGRFETSLVPLETFQGEPIWRTAPTPEEVAARRERYWRPYHDVLERHLRAKVERFGHCFLIDAHSVESRANRLHGALAQDIFLGDRDGKTCEPWFTDLVRSQFADRALAVSLNDPYKGGYVTAHYPSIDGVQTLQIEMCQRLYMTEGQPAGARQQKQFADFGTMLRGVFAAIASAVS